MKKGLNLGCGYVIRKDWVNLDFIEHEGVDIIHDLNVFPYPFRDNQFDEIELSQILEHLDRPEKVIQELYRIGKNGCTVNIYTPHFSSWSVWGDITHKRPFNSTSLDHVSINKKQINLLDKNQANFIVEKKIVFEGLFKIFQPIVNLHNATRCFYERNFAYMFPAKELIFKLTVVKDE